MRCLSILCMAFFIALAGCTLNHRDTLLHSQQSYYCVMQEDSCPVVQPFHLKPILMASDIHITEDLLYHRYTLDDVYPYQDTVRSFKWEIISSCLAFIENMQSEEVRWCVLQNFRNANSEAPLVRCYVRNRYHRIADTLGVERYQSVPLYVPVDTLVPEIYGRDGTPAKFIGTEGSFYRVQPLNADGEWMVPQRYIRLLSDTAVFNHVIFVDRHNQNITTLERVASTQWRIRSKNPATTGRFAPPYAQPTPLGIFLLQQKKVKMVYLKDGTKNIGGFAPYASRFTNGAYIHGVPVNAPATEKVEYSWSLGTVPRSHMCVRNATSHAEFIYNWAPVEGTLIVVLE